MGHTDRDTHMHTECTKDWQKILNTVVTNTSTKNSYFECIIVMFLRRKMIVWPLKCPILTDFL